MNLYYIFFRFNRAALINVGFLESGKDCDYIVMYDVDLVLVNFVIIYFYFRIGVYYVVFFDFYFFYYYKKFVGGILFLIRDVFISV